MPNEWRSESDHPVKFIIENASDELRTRALSKESANIALISQLEPKKVEEALKDNEWIKSMKEELD